MDVPAIVTHVAQSRWVGPFHLEERGRRGMQLRLAPPELLVAAHKTLQNIALYFYVDRFRRVE